MISKNINTVNLNISPDECIKFLINNLIHSTRAKNIILFYRISFFSLITSTTIALYFSFS